MPTLRIFIADDHDLMRRGLRALLEGQRNWLICGEATKGREAVAKVAALRPDIVILDICMPELNGIEATRQIRKVSPRTEVLVLSVHQSNQLIREVLEAGARGFVLKSDSATDLVSAIESLADHRPFFTACAAEMLLGGYGTAIPNAPASLPSDLLTSREREIVQLLAEGKTSKEVASTLNISAKTAETHRANIMKKMEFHSVGEIVRYAVRNQIIEA